MRVFVTTAMQEPGVATYTPLFRSYAAKDRFGVHQLCEDAETADLILFLDGHQHYRDLELSAIRKHPLVLKYREKAFVYSEMDQPWCAMPGLYVSMPKSSFEPQRQRACAYLKVPNDNVMLAPEPEPDAQSALLFSFLGRRVNATRGRVLSLRHPRAVIMDTSAMDFFGDPVDKLDQQRRRYAEVMARTKFVLCPLGAGTSSFRVFETMAAGRVPVILSDEWAPPAGPDWDRCAIFVPEKEVESVGRLLEKREGDFPAMSLAARREWEDWFAPDVIFHRMTESLKDIMEKRQEPEAVLCRKITKRYLWMRARAMKSKLREVLHRPGRKRRAVPAMF